MAQPFIGEIRMFGGNFAPVGWAFCNGQMMLIAENVALFSLIGTTYGGDGQTTFALPNLQSRIPVHAGLGFALGQVGGAETVTLTPSQIPVHTHAALASGGPASEISPAGSTWAAPSSPLYSTSPPAVAMNAQTVGSAGGSQSHDNMQPFLAVNFIISLFGIFPSQT